MKDLEKLKGVISDEDIQSLQESFIKNVDETVALKLEESMKTFEATIKADYDKKLAEEIEKVKALAESELIEKTQVLEEKLIDKLDVFIESYIDENFTKELVESYAIDQTCKPIVESIMKVFETDYVALDTTGHGLLKEAKEEILKANDKINQLHSKNIELMEAIEQEKTQKLIVEKTMELTGEQKDRVVSMFEGKSFDEVNSKIDTFLSIVTMKKETVINEGVTPAEDGVNIDPKPLNESVSKVSDIAMIAGRLIKKLDSQK